MLNSLRARVGTIECCFGEVPEHCLPLTGGTYSRFDYPELWGVLPDGMKTGIDFTLPDFTGLFLMGGPLSGVRGGEAEHTLTLAEIPAHDHGGHTHIPLEVSGEVPNPTSGEAIPDLFGSRGGGLPHNNLPPFYSVVYYVISE